MNGDLHRFLLVVLTVWAIEPAGAAGAEREPAIATASSAQPPAGNPRLIVLTDIGGDPDDQQSMVRLMTYSSEFAIEGFIASASGTPGELKREVVQPQLIREIVQGYGKVRESLLRHDPAFPPTEKLLDCIKSGNPRRGLNHVGAGYDTEGSQWIVRVADRPDPRPVNVAIWGGQTDLAQALWRVRQDRGEDSLKAFLARLRVYDIGDQDRIQEWIFANFPDLFYILAGAPKNADRRLGAYRGMYLGGDDSLTSRQWIDTYIRGGHGPLGALYPPTTWTAPNPHSALKEGDTPSWFYFLSSGLSDPARPDWGSWGGRFQHARHGLYRDAKDTVGDTTDARAAVWRWRPAFQNDLRCRMEWCVKPFSQANHRPVAVVNGDRSIRVLRIAAPRGAPVKFNATTSSDPDGNRLTYHWSIYGEAGTYGGKVMVRGQEQAEAEVVVPADAVGKTIHLVLEVQDDGQPPLTSYRRAVLEVR